MENVSGNIGHAGTAMSAVLITFASFRTWQIWKRDPPLWWQTGHGESKVIVPNTAEYEFDNRQQTLRFVALWTLVLFTIGGFAPAYVLAAQGYPWYFDALRQIGRNILDRPTTLHAVCALAWCMMILHQTITAFVGGIGKNSATGTSWYAKSHRTLGYFAAAIAIIMSASGTWILQGSTKARYYDQLTILLVGFFVVLNVVAGILHVRRGDIPEHKQYMGWAIIWTANPGILRFFGYISRFLKGNPQTAQICHQVLATDAPRRCQALFMYLSNQISSDECGIGLLPVFLSFVCCAFAGCTMTSRMERWCLGPAHGNLVAFAALASSSFANMLLHSHPSAIFESNAVEEEWKSCTRFLSA